MSRHKWPGGLVNQEEGTTAMLLQSFAPKKWSRSRPESGLDRLICAIFARQVSDICNGLWLRVKVLGRLRHLPSPGPTPSPNAPTAAERRGNNLKGRKDFTCKRRRPETPHSAGVFVRLVKRVVCDRSGSDADAALSAHASPTHAHASMIRPQAPLTKSQPESETPHASP